MPIFSAQTAIDTAPGKLPSQRLWWPAWTVWDIDRSPGHIDEQRQGAATRQGRCRGIKDCPIQLLSYGSLRSFIHFYTVLGLKSIKILFYPAVLLGPPAIPLFSLALIEQCGPCCWENPRCSPPFCGWSLRFFHGSNGSKVSVFMAKPTTQATCGAPVSASEWLCPESSLQSAAQVLETKSWSHSAPRNRFWWINEKPKKKKNWESL